MRIAFFIASLLLFCTAQSVKAAQVPLFSAFNLSQQLYNPAFAGYHNKYELSILGGYGSSGLGGYDGFNVLTRSNNQVIKGSGLLTDPNYSGIAVSIPIQLKLDKRLGIGVSYTNNDLQPIETSNTFALSLAYNWKTKKGRFAMGFDFKRIVFSATDKRIYYAYEPSYQVMLNSYKEKAGNFDLGIMYTNDSGTLDIGLSLGNLNTYKYAANSLDNIYQFYYESTSQVIANTNFQFKISEKLTSKNNFMGATNANNFKYTNYLMRSVVCYKKLGFGFQYEHKRYPAFGPAITFSNSKLDILYSYLRNINNNKIVVSGLHEIGLRLKI
jgi:type IX secretion system PorP/SprF family membrane protein